MFALERPFTAVVDGVSVEAAGIAIGSDDPERGPDSGGVHRRADTYEPLFRWSIQHSSYAYGTSAVYEYLQKAWAFTIEPVVERITWDVLLLSAREDLLVDFSLYKQEIDLLKNTRSLEFVVPGRTLNGQANCNMGNTRYMLDLILNWNDRTLGR